MSIQVGRNDRSPELPVSVTLTDIIGRDELQRLQDLFSAATGVASIITLPDGMPVTSPSNFCSLCKIVRSTPNGMRCCLTPDKFLPNELSGDSAVFSAFCSCTGLLDAGIRIVVDGLHLGNWVVGQVREPDTTDERLLESANEIGADQNVLRNAFLDVPVMSADRLKSVVKILEEFACELTLKAYNNYQLKLQVSEKQQANERLQKSEESLSITLESIADAVITTDVSGSILWMNPAAERICRRSLGWARGRLLSDVIRIYNSDPVAGNDLAAVSRRLDETLKVGTAHARAEGACLVSEEGIRTYISYTLAPIKNGGGLICGTVLTLSDITEKYEAEAALAESERSKSVFLSNLPGMAYRCKCDEHWTMEFVSEGCLELTGYHPDDLIDNRQVSFNELIFPEYRSWLYDTWTDAVKNHKTVTVEYQIMTADGNSKWVWEQGIPVRDNQGQVVALEGMVFDISNDKKIADVLRETSKFLNQACTIARLGTFTLDFLNDNCIFSSVLEEVLGVDPEEKIEASKLSKVIHPDCLSSLTRYFMEDVAVTGNKFDKECKIIRMSDGEVRWIHVLGELQFAESGQFEKMVGTVQDISDRKLADQKLIISEQNYRSLFENVKDVFFRVDLNGIVMEISPSVSQHIGAGREEVIGRSVYDFYANPADREILLQGLYQTGEVQEFELDFTLLDGRIIHVSINAHLIKDLDGMPVCVEGTIRDISKRKRTEAALRDSELKLRSYFDYAPHGVFVSNAEGFYIEVNMAATLITGYGNEELCAMDPALLIAPESQERFFAHFRNAVENGFASDEFVIVRKDQTKAVCKVDSVKLSDNRFIGFVEDITQQKEAENSLKESERFLRETQSIAQLGNYSFDFSTQRWTSSEVLDSLLGIGAGFDKSIRTWKSLIHPDFIGELAEYLLDEVLPGKLKFNKSFKIIKADTAEERWVHGIGEFKCDESGKVTHIIGTIQDITERVITAEALRESEVLYRSILNTSPDAIVVVDTAGYIRMVSPVTVSIYGCKSESELLGHSMFDFLLPSERERAQINTAGMFEGYLGVKEYQIMKADGTTATADINGDVIRNHEGIPTGIVFVIRDVTERKNVEVALQQSQAQLKVFAKHLDSVREEERVMLAREIHDELGQILIAIKIDLGIVKQQVMKKIKDTDARTILDSFANITELVNNTINTTRKIMTDLRPEILYMVGFEEAVKTHARHFQQRHKIRCRFENKVPDLELNSQQSVTLYRILQESLFNVARHSKATDVNVSVYKQSCKLVLEVADNGVGFDQRKKRRNDSYGLIGMQERVLLLDGDSHIKSEMGTGTVIQVKIPYQMPGKHQQTV